MSSKQADKPTYAEREGTVKCLSCGSTFEIVSTSKDGKQTIICSNCDLDKTPDYSEAKP
jgi:hypothetical protein